MLGQVPKWTQKGRQRMTMSSELNSLLIVNVNKKQQVSMERQVCSLRKMEVSSCRSGTAGRARW